MGIDLCIGAARRTIRGGSEARTSRPKGSAGKSTTSFGHQSDHHQLVEMLTDLAQNEKKKLLEQSLAAGIIDRARFEEVLAESLNTGPRAGLVVSGTRVKGAMVVADHSGMWITVATGYE